MVITEFCKSQLEDKQCFFRAHDAIEKDNGATKDSGNQPSQEEQRYVHTGDVVENDTGATKNFRNLQLEDGQRFLRAGDSIEKNKRTKNMSVHLGRGPRSATSTPATPSSQTRGP